MYTDTNFPFFCDTTFKLKYFSIFRACSTFVFLLVRTQEHRSCIVFSHLLFIFQTITSILLNILLWNFILVFIPLFYQSGGWTGWPAAQKSSPLLILMICSTFLNTTQHWPKNQHFTNWGHGFIPCEINQHLYFFLI